MVKNINTYIKKYITSNVVKMVYPYRTDVKLDKRLSAVKLKELRKRWVNEEPIQNLADEIGYCQNKLRLIFLGDSCYGLFQDYSEMPKHLKRRRDKKNG